jgi:hypothetical protein
VGSHVVSDPIRFAVGSPGRRSHSALLSPNAVETRWKTCRFGLRCPQMVEYRATSSRAWRAMTDEGQVWEAFLRGALSDDPEWAKYLSTLGPRTPLREAIAGYLRLLKTRVAVTPDEARKADQLLNEMQARGVKTTDDLVAAIERRRRPRRPRRTNGKPARPMPGWEPGGA